MKSPIQDRALIANLERALQTTLGTMVYTCDNGTDELCSALVGLEPALRQILRTVQDVKEAAK